MRRKSITFRLALFFASTSILVLLAFSAMVGYLVDEHFKKLDIDELAGKLALGQFSLQPAMARVSTLCRNIRPV